jgi:hypothetical protein
MVAAFFLVAAYLGLMDFGSQMMDPPPQPRSAVAVPALAPAVAAVTLVAHGDSSAVAADDR